MVVPDLLDHLRSTFSAESKVSYDEFFELWNCHFTVNHGILPHVEALLGRVKVLLLSNTNELHARFLRQRKSAMTARQELAERKAGDGLL